MMYQMESHRPFSVGQELSQSCSWRCVCFFPPCLVALPVLTILPVDALDLYLYMYIYIYIHRVYIYIVFILCQPRTVVGQHPIPSDQHSTFGAQTISISKVFDTHHIEN